jgi:outer membrane protein assembly factor BamE (lipoprotein component of BamABCDE complex)
MRKIFGVLALSLLLISCRGDGDANDRLTAGTVQREIRIGMTSADVVSVLGSPNVVTTDEQRREVWVYDKMSSSVTTSSSGVWLLVVGSSSSNYSSSQRTLTIIVKFDNNAKVRDFAYRTSSF